MYKFNHINVTYSFVAEISFVCDDEDVDNMALWAHLSEEILPDDLIQDIATKVYKRATDVA